MKELTQEERINLNNLLRYKPHKKEGYYYFTSKKKHYKRSRVLLQLHLNKKFDIWEHVHHKDNNKENDAINNLIVLSDSEHTSISHAGKRRSKSY